MSKAKTKNKPKRERRQPRYKVVLMLTAAQLPTVEAKAKAAFGESVVMVRKVDLEKSRADRLEAIAGEVSDAATSVEELHDELQEWYDNLPEQFQQADKGQELEEAISNLDTIKSELEAVDFSNVSFPSMM